MRGTWRPASLTLPWLPRSPGWSSWGPGVVRTPEGGWSLAAAGGLPCGQCSGCARVQACSCKLSTPVPPVDRASCRLGRYLRLTASQAGCWRDDLTRHSRGQVLATWSVSGCSMRTWSSRLFLRRYLLSQVLQGWGLSQVPPESASPSIPAARGPLGCG